MKRDRTLQQAPNQLQENEQEGVERGPSKAIPPKVGWYVNSKPTWVKGQPISEEFSMCLFFDKKELENPRQNSKFVFCPS